MPTSLASRVLFQRGKNHAVSAFDEKLKKDIVQTSLKGNFWTYTIKTQKEVKLTFCLFPKQLTISPKLKMLSFNQVVKKPNVSSF